eukprot:1584727-Alexandrium_andersonii.AAC.1
MLRKSPEKPPAQKGGKRSLAEPFCEGALPGRRTALFPVGPEGRPHGNDSRHGEGSARTCPARF